MEVQLFIKMYGMYTDTCIPSCTCIKHHLVFLTLYAIKNNMFVYFFHTEHHVDGRMLKNINFQLLGKH